MFYTARELAQDHDVELLVVDEEPVGRSAVETLEETFDAVHVFSYPTYRFYMNTLRGIISRHPLQTHYYRFTALDSWLDANEDRFDLMYCNHVRTTEYVRHRETPRVVDLVDAISRNYRAAQSRARGLWRAIYPIEWRRLARYERTVVESFDHAFITTEEDRKFVSPAGDESTLSVLPNGVKPELLDRTHTPTETTASTDGGTIVFLGKMDYFPNEDAATYFATEVFPQIREARPEAEFFIVGSNPTAEVTALADHPGVTVTGFVDDPVEYFDLADVAVAPMRYGAGLQNKVLEALSLSCPTVVTPLAWEGIQAIDGKHLVVADTAEQLADETISLLDSPARRARLGRAGHELIASTYTWERIGQQLRTAVQQVLSNTS
ncbi:glycosyltransferase [Haloferax sp. Atlit-6N]|uniref:glycosyltransferase n=1 Tax=Haloferax sp. Atlit-6N TaxID=2077205 RepID=UPI0013147BAE|nr:glycosyltransferase [Haloferax sp. Atlit-6N]